MIRQTVSILSFLLFTGLASAQPVILHEQFEKNSNNTTALSSKILDSGQWQFYYTDCSYNGITHCAVVKYSGSSMGYMVTPPVDKPHTLIFDARTVGNVSNWVEIQKSVNGGAYTTVDKVLVSGTSYKQYTVDVNETRANVKLRFLRTKTASDGSNYNIMIDNIQVLGSAAPVLQVSNGKNSITNGKAMCLPPIGNASYIEIPLTLTNTGSETLVISNIEALGVCAVVGDKRLSIDANSSVEMMVRISGTTTGQGFIAIYSNSSGCSPFTVRFNAPEERVRASLEVKP